MIQMPPSLTPVQDMPITKQAIKQAKQNEVRRQRNRHNFSRMKSMLKLILMYIQGNEAEKAKAVHAQVVKTIDMAAKKNLIHKNNAARKKSRIERALKTMGSTPSPKALEKKPAKAKASKFASAKKAAPKKAE